MARSGDPGGRFRGLVSFHFRITCVTPSCGRSVWGRFCPDARGQGPWKGIPGSRKSTEGTSEVCAPILLEDAEWASAPAATGKGPDGSKRDLPCDCESDETGCGSQPCDLWTVEQV